jgi:large conductance mechanosensitive channel
MWSDFKAFMLKQNALALAIAVVLGTALNTVVTAVVNDFIMPIVAVLTPSGTWRTAVWTAGPFKFGIGDFVSAVLNFVIVGLVVWRMSKFLPKEAPAPAVRACPNCFSTIDARATRCPQCTSEVAATVAATAS